jgi:hypothetical protein
MKNHILISIDEEGLALPKKEQIFHAPSTYIQS